MDLEGVFSACNTLALIGWLFLLVAPRWRYTRRIIIGGLISLLLALVYITMIFSGPPFDPAAFSTLKSVMQLLNQPTTMLAGWVHYLAFDLFIGTWQVANAQKLGIPHWLVVPCLLFTFMLGPVGLFLYFIARTIYTKQFAHDNF